MNNVPFTIPPEEYELSAIRAQGAGGQNVNKVSTAIHLRFDVHASSLPPEWKERLLSSGDQRVSNAGVIIIKAQRYRSQEQNKDDAVNRLHELVQAATVVLPPRRATKPTRASKIRRADAKVGRGKIKALRGKVTGE